MVLGQPVAELLVLLRGEGDHVAVGIERLDDLDLGRRRGIAVFGQAGVAAGVATLGRVFDADAAIVVEVEGVLVGTAPLR